MTNPQGTRGPGLFGTSTGQSGGLGLFGSGNQPQNTGNLFGGGGSTAAAPTSSNLFPTFPSSTTGGLFGSSNNPLGAQPQSSNLFGTQQPTSSGLFTTQTAPFSSSGLFPGIQSSGITSFAQPSPLTLP